MSLVLILQNVGEEPQYFFQLNYIIMINLKINPVLILQNVGEGPQYFAEWLHYPSRGI